MPLHIHTNVWEGASGRMQSGLQRGLHRGDYLGGFCCSVKLGNGGNGRKPVIRDTKKDIFRR